MCDSDLRPHISYNKGQDVPTLIGNWHEERALKALTGAPRLQPWTDGLNGPSRSVYPARCDIAVEAGNPTALRDVDHDDQYFSSEWRSTNQIVYQPPQDRPYDMIKYKQLHGDFCETGLRKEREISMLLAEAAKPAPARPRPPPDFESTYSTSFVQPPMNDLQVGARVMKTQDGGPPSRDAVFLAESTIMEKQAADRLVGRASAEAVEAAASASDDPAITVWSDAKRSGNTLVYSSKWTGATPFGRSTNFTKDMSDYSKIVEDE